MRASLFIGLLLFVASQSLKPEQKATAAQQQANTDQRGTEQSPLVVKTIPASNIQAEAERERQDRETKTENERRMVRLTLFIAVLQLLVYGYQSWQLRKTVKAAGEQSQAMERHIGEAARSATAMEGIASVIQVGNKAIIRAYLNILIGEATFQERRGVGQVDLKFGSDPIIQNNGNSNARNVNFQIAADILPVPPPDDFAFPLPAGIGAAGLIGPHQNSIISAVVKEFVPDGEVTAIKEATKRALYVWGMVTYDDVFGARHFTKFGYIVFWSGAKVFGSYLNGQNDGD